LKTDGLVLVDGAVLLSSIPSY